MAIKLAVNSHRLPENDKVIWYILVH